MLIILWPEFIPMNGVHDIGGMHGFGTVDTVQDDELFHEPWEARAFGV